MWCQKCMNFENMTLKFFHVFRKKLKKKWIFLTPPTYWKSEEKHKKKDFFLKNYKNQFPINNGWKLKKKTQNKFISFTIVNTKTIVHTTVNTCCFSMILPRIVPFSVCFTIVIFEKSLFSLETVLWTSKYHFWEVDFLWPETYFNF